jgi:hypothetical protein
MNDAIPRPNFQVHYADMASLVISNYFPPILHEGEAHTFFNQGPVSLDGYETIIFTQLGSQLYTPLFRETSLIWRQLISNAASRGSVIVVFLDHFIADLPMDAQFQPIGESPVHNFEFLPPFVEPLEENSGRDIQLGAHPLMTPLWKATQKYWTYSATIGGTTAVPLALSKTHQKPVSGLYKMGQGCLILLPEFDWRHPDLFHSEIEEWTPLGLKTGEFFRAYFLKLYPHLKAYLQQL